MRLMLFVQLLHVCLALDASGTGWNAEEAGSSRKAMMRTEISPPALVSVEFTADGHVENDDADLSHPHKHHRPQPKAKEEDMGSAVGGFFFGLIMGMFMAAGCLGVLFYAVPATVVAKISEYCSLQFESALLWLKNFKEKYTNKKEEEPAEESKPRRSLRTHSAPPRSRYPQGRWGTREETTRPAPSARGCSSSDSDSAERVGRPKAAASAQSKNGLSTASSAQNSFTKKDKSLAFQNHVETDRESTSASSHSERTARR
mmetsp:Transcript_97751/g.174154  ORF Transcript_97751/g.174154 Transcript_97751/m.174154 type:complete len:259 (+) Transcript_97751:119-895(+)|eukprot:CAMPEP_0197630848 /NCGR_PEP_ID=MMETSP1338-20131121/8203_1 /TAXON_ID=43686 ORGANISM="Pelagodinium beii, Strain RCC1491" /NCGR_SAMPLE_ID=MMETSP1338 /ASSEMBLY_ACC=CAM_ASM_000754 /LENGTH=258 /DNA_ID=CAMNT_0043202161 /DNA_START=119 /DNA_END=895 /DNA_ORIENTATION=-